MAAARTWSASFVWTALGQLVQGMTRVIAVLLVAKVAGKDAAGQVNTLLALVTLMMLCWPQGVGVAAVRFVSAARATGRPQEPIARALQRLSLLPTTVLAISAAILAATIYEVRPVGAMCTGAMVLAFGLSAVVRGIRLGRQAFGETVAWDAVAAVIALTTLGGILWLGTPELLLLPLAASYLPGVVSGWTGTRADRFAVPGIVSFSAWTSAQILAAGGLLPAVTVVAATATSSADLGDLAAATTLATPVYLLATALRGSAEPHLAREFALGHSRAAAHLVDQLFRLMVLTFVPLITIAALWSDLALQILFDAEFAAARPVLVVLLFGVLITCLTAAQSWLNTTTASGPRLLALSNLAGMVTGVAVALATVPWAGVMGAAVGFVAGSVISVLAATLLVWRQAEMRWAATMVRLSSGVATSLLCVVTVGDSPVVLRLGVTIAFLGAWLASQRAQVTTLSRHVRSFITLSP